MLNKGSGHPKFMAPASHPIGAGFRIQNSFNIIPGIPRKKGVLLLPKRPGRPCPGAGKFKGRCPSILRDKSPVCSRCLPYHKAHTRQATQESKKEYDRGRGNSNQRGYGVSWQRLRKMVLAREPLCRRCNQKGILKPAYMVHHIDGNSSNNFIENLEPLCTPCHNRVHGGAG